MPYPVPSGSILAVEKPVVKQARNADAEAIRSLVLSIPRDCGLAPDPAAADADLQDLEAVGLYLSFGFRPGDSNHLSARGDQAYYLDPDDP